MFCLETGLHTLQVSAAPTALCREVQEGPEPGSSGGSLAGLGPGAPRLAPPTLAALWRGVAVHAGQHEEEASGEPLGTLPSG